MEIVNVIQGTPAWHIHRANHFNASDAPAMMGISPYETRDQLLARCATGIPRDFPAEVQLLFSEGHRTEALARPLAEEFLREDLMPCVGTDGKLSASFDGLTLCDEINWECKMLNQQIRDAKGPLPIHKIQMSHQMFVAGKQCNRTLFTAASFDPSGECLEIIHTWYERDEKLIQEVLIGWLQFEKDLTLYQFVAPTQESAAAAVRELPSVSAQVEGRLISCNLGAVTPYFDRFLSEAVTELVTDDDFALAEAQSKIARKAAKECRFVAKSVIDQMASVAVVSNTMNFYADKLDACALAQEKAVKSQKELRKTIAKLESDKSYEAHVAALNAKLRPVRLLLSPQDQPNFVEVMKNQRRLDSIYSKLADELARAKICADRVFADYREKLDWFTSAAPNNMLFPDLQSLLVKPMEDFKLTVSTRIAQHHAAEQERLEAQRERIRIEEEAKARAKVEAEAAAAVPAHAERVQPVVPSVLEKMPLYEYIQPPPGQPDTDEIGEFLMLGGIPDDLMEFTRMTIERFLKWRAARENH